MKRLLLLLAIALGACSPRAKAIFIADFHHDAENACTFGQMGYNKAECARWREMEPKQYARYLARLEKYKQAGLTLRP
jgi:hypothetical protein